MMRHLFFGTVGLPLLLACSAGGEDPGPQGGGSGGLAWGSSGGAAGAGNTPVWTSSGGATEFPGTGNGTGGGTAPATCPEITQKAEAIQGGKADIIFIIDNSLSMVEEAAAVQKNLNAFSQQIKASGVDVRVVMISSAPTGANGACIDPTGIACIFVPGLKTGETGVCIDPPLGAEGKCPKDDETNRAGGYLHVREPVGSNDALRILQDTFNRWQDMLRPDAVKTFVIVTDDDARGTSAEQFQGWVNSQPVFQGATWRFGGLYCVTKGANCYNAGLVYHDLVARTQGLTGDMAQFGSGNIDAQFKTVFDKLAEVIVKDAVPVPCEYTIPAPPGGNLTFDRDKLNVAYTNGGGTREDFFSVEGDAQCTDQVGAWFYDNNENPTKIRICPQACTRIQADDKATMQIQFGCKKRDIIK